MLYSSKLVNNKILGLEHKFVLFLSDYLNLWTCCMIQ